MFIAFLLFFGFLAAALVGLAALVTRNTSTSRFIGIAFGAFCVAFAASVLTWFSGYLSPIENLLVQPKIHALERTLRVGETRAEVEAHFGHDVPRPDRLDGYAVSAEYAVPGWGDHLGQYAYESGGCGMCTFYSGLVVFYDQHERVKFWKPYGFGEGV